MKKLLIPICHHPSTITWIDDERQYLDFAMGSLGEYYALDMYSEPNGAIETLNANYQHDSFLEQASEYVEGESDQFSQAYNMREIHQCLYNKNRFDEKALFIVDYAMPSMNGLAFIESLNDNFQHCRYVLLTGQAGEQEAVHAFNNNIIHYYQKKNAEELRSKIIEIIKEQSLKYFLNLSQYALNSDDNYCDTLCYALQDQKIADAFFKAIDEYNIVEYYLINSEGDFLLISKDGQYGFFILKHESTMKNYQATASFDEAPKSVIDKLTCCSHVPLFFSEDDLDSQPSHWDNYLYPATKMETEQGNYYYHILYNPEELHQLEQDFLTYRDFLRDKNS